jgi:ectoine hydroxylase-related dioxygenase (phytanoyl-CoA dioxygenase family)
MESSSEHAIWNASGVIAVPALLTRNEVDELRHAFDALRAAGAPTSQQLLYTHEAPREARPPFGALMEQWLNPRTHPAAEACLDAASRLGGNLAALLGEELYLFQDALMSKQAGQREFPWHQDEPYWPVSTPGGAVVWCALDNVGPSNGGLEVAVGSHTSGLGAPIDLHTGEPQGCAREAVADLSEFAHRCPELSPGDALIFHPRTWHRSGPNVTGASRRVWSSSWLPAGARWCVSKAPRHPLSRHLPDGEPVAQMLAKRTRA